MAGRSWPFEDTPDLGVFVSRMVWSGDEPLLGVRHHEDGDWTFWGTTEPDDSNADELLMYVHLGHVYDRFPELAAIADVPRDRSATRSAEGAPFIEGE